MATRLTAIPGGRATDGAGNTLVRAARTSAVDEIGVFPYRFPLKGNFPYGDPGSRFGAKRTGHTHQGQDISAPEGTPVVAPRGGRVTTVAYQAEGAGHYVVLDADDAKGDAERQKLKEPAAVSRLFDFTLQQEVNAELGIR